MLTVKEINEVSFGKAGFSGYKPEDVDKFIDQVAASFQELLGERDAAVKQASEVAKINGDIAAKNADAQKKLSILAQKIEVYRQEEEGIKEAILSAQRMSKDLIREAQERADAIVQDARAQAEAKISQANEEARRITDTAQEQAVKDAKEYAQRAATKKAELEEIKRQVTAFRASLLEMYKKHLESIDHIPVFREKEEASAPAPKPEEAPTTQSAPAAEPSPQHFAPAAPTPQPVMQQEPLPEPEPPTVSQPVAPVRQPVREQQVQAAPPAQAEPQPRRERRPVSTVKEEPAQPRAQRTSAPPSRTYQERSPRPERTLNDRVNYVQEQLQPSQPPEDYLNDGDLSSVGIDLNAHSNIPEALRREKSSNYSNLPFGDGVDVDGRKRKR